MSKTLSFIKKSNQVLFFIAVTLFIIVVSIDFITDFFDNKYEPPKIALVDNKGEQTQVKKTQYTIEYFDKLKDVYIFELSSKEIDISQTHDGEIVEMFAKSEVSLDLYTVPYLSKNAVNLMFVRENGERHMLLKKDGLILDISKAKFATNEAGYLLDRNLYLIINEDTNQNGYLDQDDSVKLFTSTFDGKDLSLVLQDVGNFSLISDNKVLISQKGKSPKFYAFEVKNSALLPLNTSLHTHNE
ncbi:hypothetical protein [Pseudoalteromonas luteoviolacea]|uniref:Uncharacterized protein n=1 Tax=Pseudoalteromonas luteoviolacea S4054 TaxID=1129367 RepID=A0A0F6A8D9_9GAMM|nr:hypothetical protein [Pseudoalteromonas luteoviolacea]AOT08682.1 hypothetical protein S4054249_12830 [Pseudoalteromonas luteoviolacea]AOT13597.1 hypothetical protein S40542_12805 [Pseudoalteromonas luteoviolacea]AOT18510.1 hypothetical protein S4054_12805 [Pseudoalteromonas luteoviolacea]KKE82482.1 hypothetical protein N479_17910 [Pseudoalteromonas luteoviolacea S4054]KZN72019.1 hypothetical protein N481_16545 [Pseudoalteromonas luteoviolacea S4047-1]